MKLLKSYRDALLFTFGYQFFILILFSYLFFERHIFWSIWFISNTAYLVPAIMIMNRKPEVEDKRDLFYLKFGSLITLVITPYLGGGVLVEEV